MTWNHRRIKSNISSIFCSRLIDDYVSKIIIPYICFLLLFVKNIGVNHRQLFVSTQYQFHSPYELGLYSILSCSGQRVTQPETLVKDHSKVAIKVRVYVDVHIVNIYPALKLKQRKRTKRCYVINFH